MSAHFDSIDTALAKGFVDHDRKAHHSAMEYWFVIDQGNVQGISGSTYEPKYHMKALQAPAGVADTYWDTLSRADRMWQTPPVKSQWGDQLHDFWMSMQRHPKIE